MFHVVLIEPEIPPNTGNIARLCAGTGCTLHLVHPLGFSTEDRYLKRAGLDYWHLVDVREHASLAAFWAAAGLPGEVPPPSTAPAVTAEPPDYWLYTTKAGRSYVDVRYRPGDYLIFGRETRGLPDDFLAAHADRCLRIPLRTGARSLNLSNATAVVVYEALRQNGFPDLT